MTSGVWSTFYTLRREVERVGSREFVRPSVEAFNVGDVDALAACRIAFQRGYRDKLSFLRIHGLPLSDRA